MDQYLSYSPYRRTVWKSHPSKLGVRRAIEHDRGVTGLRIFQREVLSGPEVYREIPRSEWSATFAD